MSDELKSCAFCFGCASPIKMSAGLSGTTGYDQWHAVRCKACGATIGESDRRFRSKDEAIAAWNRRALSSCAASAKDNSDHVAVQLAEPESSLKAARWDALLSSARIRILGAAGFDGASDYRHFGMEIWTKYGKRGQFELAEGNAYGRKILTEYADAILQSGCAALEQNHRPNEQASVGVGEQYKKDAERYRWLRFADLDALASTNWGAGEVYTGEQFDAAIDAAMKEQP
jgi:hypothetical protein